jgi:hypothetical protein
VTAPYFKRLEKTYKVQISKALENDYKIDYYKPKKVEEISGLPGTSSGTCLVDRLEHIWDGPFVDFFWSIGLLVILIKVRDSLTPDILHFITCVVEEEAHFIWIMMFWLFYKCSLTLSDQKMLLTEK